jgi:DNA-nicking Smr family endonuclease
MASTPESIQDNASNYKSNAWEQYTLQELGNWVHLFTRRAEHRDASQVAKIEKDLMDAQAYLDMMQAKVDEAKQKLVTFKVN